MRDESRLKYTTTHEWVDFDPNGSTATVGISRFAVEQLTDLIHIELPKPGAEVVAGKAFGEIESVKAVSDLYSPVTGEVLETNSAVVADVQSLAADPYDKGWLVKVKLAKSVSSGDWLDHAGYQKRIAEEAH
jgi:glycine cleavage system H protein